MPHVGELVFVHGNQAAMVIHVDDGDNVYVGHFAGAEKIEKGDYGTSPGIEAENRPSFVPKGAETPAPVAGTPVIPVAGAPVAEPTTEPQEAPKVLI